MSDDSGRPAPEVCEIGRETRLAAAQPLGAETPSPPVSWARAGLASVAREPDLEVAARDAAVVHELPRDSAVVRLPVG